ncbi:amino acid ABC transporter permease [Paraburkholderia sp. HD33-4]|uniref:amino acid ABC transporter permease n=1 Tax=Paraburkholderia sp. HD33-4 TaxID=2883242 RepID=UPI001F345288|nr:amino acid ABC transporter permease [Paraburkholderia sp. HD33-4]
MHYQFDFSAIAQYRQLLVDGTIETLKMSLVSMALALVAGIIVMLAKKSTIPPLRWMGTVFIEVIRNTPFLVQLLFIYFGLASLSLKLSVTQAAVTALTVNAAAYVAEIVRGGVEAIHKGQIEAGAALGLKSYQIFWNVVLRPSIRSVYPALCSQFILLVLSSSIVSSISAAELTSAAQQVESASFRSFEVYLVVTAIYLALSITLSTIFKLFGRVYFAYPTK